MQTLHQILSAVLHKEGAGYYRNAVPSFIYSNLREQFVARPYQQEAFGRFAYFWDEYEGRNKKIPVHILFQMATGSGKTLIMAGLIVYLYTKGYRNFLFFVNSSNIIDKTRNNFLNPASSKYLFTENLFIGGRPVRIKEAANFQYSQDDDITIVFSTIQGLHSRLNSSRENNITFDDFGDKKIVLISDEAHHINTDTKRKNRLYNEEIASWEGTVGKILKAHDHNVMLEFTATADLSEPDVAKKYSDKLIYDYSLREFRRDGFSKEVKVLQSHQTFFKRALQAILLSQYRRKLFEKHRGNIKPVILFKSGTIKESHIFYNEFIGAIKNLKASDLDEIRKPDIDDTLELAFLYFENNGISNENLAIELREDFSEEKLISVNSKEESEEKQLAVNSLEDASNQYRAVFAVDKLNEGWDVLNLFDIVRLTDTKATRTGAHSKTTMSEAQLIGRGARYCPFQAAPGQPVAARKFDEDPENELRVCEELFYHSSYNPRYIHELNISLELIGIKPAISEPRIHGIPPDKEKLKHQQDPASFIKRVKEKKYCIVLNEPGSGEYKVDLSISSSLIADAANETGREYRLIGLGDTVIRKAMNKLPFYTFSNLKKVFPALSSVTEFISSGDYLGDIRLDIMCSKKPGNNILSPQEKLTVSIQVLDEISGYLTGN